MTGPARSPASPKAPRTRRIYWLWGLALALLAAVGLVCWLLVVPLMQVHSVLGERAARGPVNPRSKPVPPPSWPPFGALDKLGGPEKAVGMLSLYYRLPTRIATRKAEAVCLISRCGVHGESRLVRVLNDESFEIRKMAAASLAGGQYYADTSRVAGVKTLIELTGSVVPLRRASAAYSLGYCGDHADLALPALIRLLEDDALLPIMPSSSLLTRDRVRDAARWSLGRISPRASNAVPHFKALLSHESEYVRRVGEQLLKKVESAGENM